MSRSSRRTRAASSCSPSSTQTSGSSTRRQLVSVSLSCLPGRGNSAIYLWRQIPCRAREHNKTKDMNNSPASQRPYWFICLCSVVLDGGGGRPVQGLGRLGATQVSRATLHQTRPRLLRRQRRHRQREPGNTQ